MTITLSQVLFFSILAVFILYVLRLRTVLTDRLVYIASALAAIVLVINPELSTRMANLLGIGRGTDLLIYLFILAGLVYSAAITSEVRRLQDQLTRVVRQIALDNPLEGSAGDVKDA